MSARAQEIVNEYWDSRGEGGRNETTAVGQLAARLAAVEAELTAEKDAHDETTSAWTRDLEQTRAERDEAREALTHLEAITQHIQGCDQPDDPLCPACVVTAALAAARTREETGE